MLENHIFGMGLWGKQENNTYIDPHDVADGGIKLFRVVEIDSDDMRSANILLCIWVLREHLREEWDVHSHNNTTKDSIWTVWCKLI